MAVWASKSPRTRRREPRLPPPPPSSSARRSMSLRDRRLDAAAIHAILAPDVIADTLDWIGGNLTEATDPPRFTGFRERARAELNLDPSRIAPEVAARRLAGGERTLGRCVATFRLGVARVLYGGGRHTRRSWRSGSPRRSASMAGRKRPRRGGSAQRLAEIARPILGRGTRDRARPGGEHGPRRDGPWAARGKAPLAHAVVHLAVIAAAPDLPGDSVAALAEAYAEDGWKADWAALAALAAAPGIGGPRGGRRRRCDPSMGHGWRKVRAPCKRRAGPRHSQLELDRRMPIP